MFVRFLTTLAVAGAILLTTGIAASADPTVAPPLRGIHGWPGSSSPQPAAAATDTAGKCAAMVGDFSNIVDAPSQVMSAKLIDAVGDLPAYCEVKGYTNPRIAFALLLPTDKWNGKFLYHGCFGVCGVVAQAACNESLTRGYACIVGDTGHTGTASDGKWAYNSIESKFEFAVHSTHATTLVGKALAAEYYGRQPVQSYFLGCSGGGRQAMAEAEYFPWDFDGIVAGAPGFGDHLTLTWGTTSLMDKNGNSLLSPADAAMINKAVMEKCSGDDGAKDGLITDPRACKFDPDALLCKGARSATCLDAAQIAALKKFYGGFVNAKGVRITHGGALPGSELSWVGNFIPQPNGKWTTLGLTTDFWRYMSFFPDPGPSWSLNQLDWEKDYKRLGAWATLSSAVNPDLHKFKDAGGKLLMYKGWADEFSPEIATDYYEMAERTMGGRAATQAFFRLFVVPGMGHCYGGEGGGEMGWLDYLEHWVEQGQAPDKVIAYPGMSKYFPGEPDYYVQKPTTAPDRAWPVYPYPVKIKYDGKGDPKNPDSFLPVE
jgi:feruloyl esterase